MVNKNYAKGYRMEKDIIKRLESVGYVVLRSGKSKFPDGIAVSKTSITLPKIFFWESKWNKFISKEEKQMADSIKIKTGLPFLVFYKKDHKIRWYEYGDKHKE